MYPTQSAFNKIFQVTVISIAGLFCCMHLHAQQSCTPVNLASEYLENPLGIDAFHPRLSWQLEDVRPDARQSAFQVFVGTDSLEVANAKGNIWQTLKLNEVKQLVSFDGKQLQPFTKYFWTVKVWDKDRVASIAKIASFETGMMEMKNWKGSWINDTRDINLKPASYFRKSFSVTKKIVRARAYIAVAGLYELYINGKQIGDHRLDPMYTRFDRRTLYVTHDITAQLQQGKNAIGVLLGNGWFNHQSTAVWYFHEAPWRARPEFCMDIRISYDDGSTETITSGKDWKTTLSPIIFNSIYTAEHYDARLEIPHWNEPSFNDSAWKEVEYCAAPSTNIVAQVLHPIRNVEEVPVASLNKINDTNYVFNLGRNIAGVTRIKVKGEAGTILRLKHGERLYTNGHVDLSNIDVHYRPTDDKDPFQTDIFILKGTGAEEIFMPKFNYKGFQYIEVIATKPVALTSQSITGYFMHSDVPAVGSISSSNPTIDKIWKATNNSYLSNLFGYPTDCPQREKNGWTGDAQIAIETGLYNFDGITIYEKWMADHRDEQQPNGVLPSIIPSDGWGYEWGNGPDWTSTIAVIPWNIYLFYGDAKLLQDCYENIKRYVDHIDAAYPSGLTTWGLGDWVPVKSKAPVELTSTAYYFADAIILAKAAKLFGKTEDYKKYLALAEEIKGAFNAKYLNTTTGLYGSGLQTELSVPLYWGLVPQTLKAKVAANLAKRIEADSIKLDVGLLGTKAILNALSENGYAELAYQLAAKETFPSWGWWIANGATTLYENWPIDAASDISMNHIMFGEIGAWMYKALGGIKPSAENPGFKNVLLQPNFVKGLDHFSATHKGPHGTISSAWSRTATGLIYIVTIPPNSTATLKLPCEKNKQLFKDGRSVPTLKGNYSSTLLAGTYRFELK
jgi:alpha-L-rhamnosidase